MAPKARGSMQSFVKTRNGSPVARTRHASGGKQTSGPFDDLKEELPLTFEMEVEGQQQNRYHKGQKSVGGAFYDTDASIDGSSTIASAEPTNAINERALQGFESKVKTEPDAEDYEYTSVSGSEDDQDDEHHGNEDAGIGSYDASQPQITGRLNSQQSAMMRQMHLVPMSGLATTYIKGDSYPNTTDGNRSVTDKGDEVEPTTVTSQVYLEQRGLNKPNQTSVEQPSNPQLIRSSNMRQPLGPQNDRGQRPVNGALNGGVHIPGKPSTTFYTQVPAASRHLQTTGPASAHSAEPARLMLIQQQQTQQPDSTLRLHQGTTSSNAQPGLNGPIPHRYARVSPVIIANNAPKLESQGRPQRSRADPKNHGSLPRDDRPVEGDVQPLEQLSDATNADEEIFDDHDVDDSELDYDLPALYQKEYAELKAEEFDVTLEVKTNIFPADSEAHTLTEKLTTMATDKPQDQARFFSTLSIDEWEEAGDWFLGRFGEVVNKLKKARQDKRKAARVFEHEIEKRHDNVSKKRKLTQEALDEMKASGSQMLLGTPKSARKIIGGRSA